MIIPSFLSLKYCSTALGGASEFFNYDKVVLANHADEALSIIENPSDDEKKILANFSYKENIAYIHTDEKVMPKNKNAWCSWNSLMDKNNVEKNSITYWLNLLQNLKCQENIFLTLNPYFEIDESKILKKVRFQIYQKRKYTIFKKMYFRFKSFMNYSSIIN